MIWAGQFLLAALLQRLRGRRRRPSSLGGVGGEGGVGGPAKIGSLGSEADAGSKADAGSEADADVVTGVWC